MTYNVLRYPIATIDAEPVIGHDDKDYYQALKHVAEHGAGFEQLVPLSSVPTVLAPYGVKQAWELRTDTERIALLAIQEADDDDDEA